MTAEPFRYFLRVRYGECDAQGIVFNARWVDYIDVAASEYTRVVFGTVDPAKSGPRSEGGGFTPTPGIDWRLVKQTVEWKSPGRYDDVLDIRVRTVRVGTTSFVLATEFRRFADGAHLATAETIYVVVDVAADVKRPIPDHHRAALERGAPGVIVDHAAANR